MVAGRASGAGSEFDSKAYRAPAHTPIAVAPAEAASTVTGAVEAGTARVKHRARSVATFEPATRLSQSSADQQSQS